MALSFVKYSSPNIAFSKKGIEIDGYVAYAR